MTHQPTILTEEQAQQLASILGCCIAADRCGDVYWFANLPNNLEGYWSDDDGMFELLPIRILSTRPWTEQIWRPETNQQPRSNEQ